MKPATLNLTIRRGVSFGPVTITGRDLAGALVPLAGWSAFSQVRLAPGEAVVLDFAPLIAADDAAGIVTLPEVTWAVTATLADGVYFWDLILQTPAGRRLDPCISGTVTVLTPTTLPT